jgi:hypothetical protein
MFIYRISHMPGEEAAIVIVVETLAPAAFRIVRFAEPSGTPKGSCAIDLTRRNEA